MTPSPTTAADLLRSAVGRVGLATATDGELVRRYATHRDDLAFAELVHRFAPAVYAVCRRHLSDPGAADDAFQAVFVLLARKAGSLIHPDRVGGWLFATADKVARTARRRQAKRSDKFRPLESVPEPSAPSSPPSDLRTLLDDELAKLPPHYRAVVVLCDVDGVSRREAAARLNIPTGTLSNRLTRARAVLGRRLLRRGVLVAAGAVVSSGSMATPPAHLLASAVRVALADSPPVEMLSLLTPVVPPMVRAKQLLLLLGALVLIGGAATGVVLLLQKPTPPPTSEAEPPKPTPPATRPQTKATFVMTDEEVAKMPQPKPRLPEDDTYAFAFSPDGRWFVRAPNHASLETKLSVIDTTSWKEVAKIDQDELGSIVRATAVSADGKRLFLTFGVPKPDIRVWDITTNRYEDKPLDVGAQQFGLRMKLSPDGTSLVGMVLASRDKHYFRFWDVKTGAVLRTIDVPKDTGEVFTFTDGGKAVAAITGSGTIEDPTYSVTEWDVGTGKELRRIDVRKAISTDRGPPIATAVAYTADGKHVIVGGGFTQPKMKPEDFKPDILTSNFPWSGSVWVIDRESGKLVKTLVDHHHDLVRGLHLTADGKKVIVNPTLPSRRDRYFSGLVSHDPEFVELQQWDVATWELDWVKIVPKAERWKLWNGAAK